MESVKNVYLYNSAADIRYRLNGDLDAGRKPDDESLSRDFTEHIVYDETELPPKVDLRQWMTKVESQSDLNSWYVIFPCQSIRQISMIVTE
jgi:hypothetical protein